jgi:MFS family permease
MMFFKRRISFFDQPMSRRTKLNFQLDFAGAGVFSMFNVVFNQFYIAMALQQGATHTQVGLLAAAPAIGLLLSPIWASMVEGKNPKPFVLFPNLIARSLLIWPALFGAPWVFVLTALVIQLLNGVQAPAYASMITRMYPADIRGRILGYVRLPMVLLMIPLAYYVGQWMDISGPPGPLIAAALTGVLAILIFVWIKEYEDAPVLKRAVKRTTFSEQWKLVKTNRILALFLAATTLSGFANLLASPLYQIIQVQKLELSNLEIAYARICYFVCLFIAYLIIGRVIDRYPIQITLLIGISVNVIVPFLYGVFGNYYATVLVGSAIQGIGDAIWDIGMLSFALRVVPGREAVVYGLHLMLFGIRGTIAPLLSTSLSEIVPFPIILLTGSAFALAGVLLFVISSKRIGKET